MQDIECTSYGNAGEMEQMGNVNRSKNVGCARVALYAHLTHTHSHTLTVYNVVSIKNNFSGENNVDRSSGSNASLQPPVLFRTTYGAMLHFQQDQETPEGYSSSYNETVILKILSPVGNLLINFIK
jgi:hypothetical protein